MDGSSASNPFQSDQPDKAPNPRALEVRARIWADDAANGLARRYPGSSAKTGVAAPTLLTLAGIGIGVILLLLLRPEIAAGIAAILFGSLILLRMLASGLAPKRPPRRALADHLLPEASIFIPAYREAAVMPHLIDGLQAVDYPVEKLDICLVLEADDLDTFSAALTHGLPPGFRILRVPPGEPRTKPRALNYALRYCSSEIVTILDAEDRPSPRQLREAAECFAAAGPDLACLQAPLNWYNREDSWITRQFALEYAAHFNVMLPLYARLGWPLPLGGTSNYFRGSVLRRAGGWDAYNVTEDADLGFRLAARGYRCDLISEPTLEEAPISIRPWILQRSRWLKGYAQTLAVQLRDLNGRHVGPRVCALAFTLGAALASALLHAPLLVASLLGLCVFWTGSPAQWAAMGFITAGYLSAGLCAHIGLRRAGMPSSPVDLLIMPFYWPLQSVAVARALWQLALAPHFWEKTEHGKSPGPSCTSPSASP